MNGEDRKDKVKINDRKRIRNIQRILKCRTKVMNYAKEGSGES